MAPDAVANDTITIPEQPFPPAIALVAPPPPPPPVFAPPVYEATFNAEPPGVANILPFPYPAPPPPNPPFAPIA